MDNLPYVTAALICEKVLEEKGGMLSAIRIVDRVDIKMQTTDQNLKIQDAPAPGVALTGLVCIKSGPFKGKGVLSIEGETPSGKIKQLGEFPVNLEGDDNGQNVILNIVFATKEDGLHWFNVRFNSTLLSKIPLRISRVLEQVAPDAQTNQLSTT